MHRWRGYVVGFFVYCLNYRKSRGGLFALLYSFPFSRWLCAYTTFSKTAYQRTFNCSENARFLSVEEAYLVPLIRTPMVLFLTIVNSSLTRKRKGKRKRKGWERRKEGKADPIVRLAPCKGPGHVQVSWVPGCRDSRLSFACVWFSAVFPCVCSECCFFVPQLSQSPQIDTL